MYYEICQNEDGEILITIEGIDKLEGELYKPRFVYDGGDKALFYRSRESAMVFNDIPKDAREPLKLVDSIFIAEAEKDEITRVYTVEVRKVKNMKGYL